MKENTLIYIIGGVLTLIMIVLFVMNQDTVTDEEKQESLYCEMVNTFIETDGKYGWPDYNGNYNKICKIK